MVILYSTNCPQCKMLERQLQNNNISFQIINNIDIMLQKGISSVPKLELEDGTILNTTEALQWAKKERT